MLVGWGILSPISKHSGWAPGAVGDITSGARGWILWISLAIMCADSLISLIPVVFEYFTEFVLNRTSSDHKDDVESETADRLVPNTWVLCGLVSSVFVGTILVWAVFGNEGIKSWATVIGFVMGGFLSIFGLASQDIALFLNAHDMKVYVHSAKPI
jgi:hypothetical protein